MLLFVMLLVLVLGGAAVLGAFGAALATLATVGVAGILVLAVVALALVILVALLHLAFWILAGLCVPVLCVWAGWYLRGRLIRNYSGRQRPKPTPAV